MKTLIMLLALFSSVAFGATVAIIDSGTDINHEELAGKIWDNPGEIAQNDFDDDYNGYVDDFHGWNFAENNSRLIDYSYLRFLTDDVKKFFHTQAKAIVGYATQDDLTWLKEMYGNKEFLKGLQVYGNFMHGTHVAGIAVKNASEAKILSVKLIPTEVKLSLSDPKNSSRYSSIVDPLFNKGKKHQSTKKSSPAPSAFLPSISTSSSNHSVAVGLVRIFTQIS